MRQEIAMDWADDLESGEYPQGFWALNENGTYCAMGVLSHRAYEEGVIERHYYESLYANGYAYDGEKFAPSPAVMGWAGLQHGSDGQIPSLRSSIMGLNDEKNLPFAKLAKIIREHWEEM